MADEPEERDFEAEGILVVCPNCGVDIDTNNEQASAPDPIELSEEEAIAVKALMKHPAWGEIESLLERLSVEIPEEE